jgi:hypothetical protein
MCIFLYYPITYVYFPPFQSTSHTTSNSGDAASAADGRRYFDVRQILQRCPELFRIVTNDHGALEVIYLRQLTRSEATFKLRVVAAEGLFIYFFAKFCHGPKFKIRLSYYEKSEPIRSVLALLTGHLDDVGRSIETYFSIYSDIFVFDVASQELTLSVDYFNKGFKEDIRPYLYNQPLFFDDIDVDRMNFAPRCNTSSSSSDEVEDLTEVKHVSRGTPPFPSSASSAQSAPTMDLLESLLAPSTIAAEEPLTSRSFPVGLCLPSTVKSVVACVLDDDDEEDDFSSGAGSSSDNIDFFGNSYDLLTNTSAIDKVAGKFGVPLNERAGLRMAVEEQSRFAFARLLSQCNQQQH